MTPDERWALIHRPFVITYHPPSYLWGGTITNDNFQDPNAISSDYMLVQGRRVRIGNVVLRRFSVYGTPLATTFERDKQT